MTTLYKFAPRLQNIKYKHQRTKRYLTQQFGTDTKKGKLSITTQFWIIFRQNQVLASIIRQQECKRPPMHFTFTTIMIIRHH